MYTIAGIREERIEWRLLERETHKERRERERERERERNKYMGQAVKRHCW